MDEILKLPAFPQPINGLHLWGGDYVKYHEDIKTVGWPCFRVGGDMDDGAFTQSVKKLNSGAKPKIAFLGRSVSDGAEAPAWWVDRWTPEESEFPSSRGRRDTQSFD